MRRPALTLLVSAAAIVFASSSAGAFSPFFTPIHLTEQSHTILKLSLHRVAGRLELRGPKPEAIKGKAPKGPVRIDLAITAQKPQARALAEKVGKSPGLPALLFVGKLKEEDGDMQLPGLPPQPPEAVLHLDGIWLSLRKAEAGDGYEMDQYDTAMFWTWAGSTPMLERCVRYILEEGDKAEVPVSTGAAWRDPDKVRSSQRIEGKVSALAPVTITDGLAQALWATSDAGDRLLAYDAKAKGLVDVTARLKLTAKTKLGLCGDFNGDGRADLASWTGRRLVIHTRQADGTFKAERPAEMPGLTGEVIGLSLLEAGGGAAPSLLLSTRDWPVIASRGKDGAWTAKPIGRGELPLKPLFRGEQGEPLAVGRAGPCLLGDLDGDLRPDILQMFAHGGLLYRGVGPGRFAAPEPIRVRLGEPPSAGPIFCDFDHDGRLDVLTASAEQSPRYWRSAGKGRFEESMRHCGELTYISRPGGVGLAVGDINDDGRQDVLIGYSHMVPVIFFNRGFHSFMHAHMLDLGERGLLTQESEKGQQAVCLADLDGDGAQDLSFVEADGRLYSFYREVLDDEPALSLRVALGAKSARSGPVTVQAFGGRWNIGTCVLWPGGPDGFVGVASAETVVLRWQRPGEEAKRREVKVAEGAIRVVLE